MKIGLVLFALLCSVGQCFAQSIQPGDTLNITVLQDSKLDRNVLVDPSGEIAVPLAGRFRVRGLSTSSVEKILKSRLRNNYKEDLDVTVAVAGVANPPARIPLEEDLKPKVFLTGEVSKPGSYVVRQQTTLIQAIALAGGLTPFAAKQRIQVRRRIPNGEAIIPFDYKAYEAGVLTDQNVSLRPGDVILIPERGLFE